MWQTRVLNPPLTATPSQSAPSSHLGPAWGVPLTAAAWRLSTPTEPRQRAARGLPRACSARGGTSPATAPSCSTMAPTGPYLTWRGRETPPAPRAQAPSSQVHCRQPTQMCASGLASTLLWCGGWGPPLGQLSRKASNCQESVLSRRQQPLPLGKRGCTRPWPGSCRSRGPCTCADTTFAPWSLWWVCLAGSPQALSSRRSAAACCCSHAATAAPRCRSSACTRPCTRQGEYYPAKCLSHLVGVSGCSSRSKPRHCREAKGTLSCQHCCALTC